MMLQPKYLQLTPEDLEKVNKARAKHEELKIDREQLFIAEFGKHFGWGGVKAILSNEIDGETAAWLVQGARKVDMGKIYDAARSTLIGVSSANSTKPSVNFKRATKDLLKAKEADL